MKIKIEQEIPDDQMDGSQDINSSGGSILDQAANSALDTSRNPATDYRGLMGLNQTKQPGLVGRGGQIIQKPLSPQQAQPLQQAQQPLQQAQPNQAIGLPQINVEGQFAAKKGTAQVEAELMDSEPIDFTEQNRQSKRLAESSAHQKKTAERNLGDASARQKLGEAQAFHDMARTFDPQIKGHEDLIADLDNQSVSSGKDVQDRLDQIGEIEMPKDNKALVAIAVFMGGIGLKGGETNQVLRFVEDRYEKNLMAMLQNKKQRASVIAKVKKIDPNLIKTKAGFINALNVLKQKQTLATAREAMAKSKSPAEKAKAQVLVAKAQEELTKQVSSLNQTMQKENESQRKYEEGKGSSVGQFNVVDVSKVKLPADRKRMIPTSGGKAYLVPEAFKIDDVRDYMVQTKKMLSNLKKLRAYLGQSLGTRTADKLKKTKRWGEMNNTIGDISAAGRKIDNMGVPQKFEMEVVSEKYGLTPDAIFAETPKGSIENAIKNIMQTHRLNLQYYNINPNDPFMY